MAQHNGSFRTAYVLDESKLTRLIDVIDDEYKALQERSEDDLDYSLQFKIWKGTRSSIQLSSLDEVLGQDNPVRNRISRLFIKGSLGTNIIEIDFQDAGKLSREDNLYLTVVGEDARWVRSVTSTVEEQLERSFVNSIFYWLNIRRQHLDARRRDSRVFFLVIQFVLAATFASLISTILFRGETRPTSTTMWLTEDQLTEYSRQLSEVETDEEKLSLLLQIQNQQITNLARQPQVSEESSVLLTTIRNFRPQLWPSILILLPLLLILSVFVYLLRYCYPIAVFAWGDCKDWYKGVEERRKSLWSVVIISMAIGIISNLFVFGISPFLNQ